MRYAPNVTSLHFVGKRALHSGFALSFLVSQSDVPLLPSLRSLKIGSFSISTIALRNILSGFPRLQKLNILEFDRGNLNAIALPEHRHLKRLTIVNGRFVVLLSTLVHSMPCLVEFSGNMLRIDSDELVHSGLQKVDRCSIVVAENCEGRVKSWDWLKNCEGSGVDWSKIGTCLPNIREFTMETAHSVRDFVDDQLPEQIGQLVEGLPESLELFQIKPIPPLKTGILEIVSKHFPNLVSLDINPPRQLFWAPAAWLNEPRDLSFPNLRAMRVSGVFPSETDYGPLTWNGFCRLLNACPQLCTLEFGTKIAPEEEEDGERDEATLRIQRDLIEMDLRSSISETRFCDLLNCCPNLEKAKFDDYLGYSFRRIAVHPNLTELQFYSQSQSPQCVTIDVVKNLFVVAPSLHVLKLCRMLINAEEESIPVVSDQLRWLRLLPVRGVNPSLADAARFLRAFPNLRAISVHRMALDMVREERKEVSGDPNLLLYRYYRNEDLFPGAPPGDSKLKVDKVHLLPESFQLESVRFHVVKFRVDGKDIRHRLKSLRSQLYDVLRQKFPLLSRVSIGPFESRVYAEISRERRAGRRFVSTSVDFK